MRSNAAILFLLACCALACDRKSKPPAAPQQNVLARVGGAVVTADDLQESARAVSPLDREMSALPPDQRKRKLFDDLVQNAAGVQEARRRGLERDPQIVKAYEKLLLNRLLSDEIYSKVTPDHVPEDQVQLYYNEHIAEFKNEDEVRVSSIFTRDEAAAKKATALAKAAWNRKDFAEDRRGFRELVRMYREVTAGPARDRSGDLTFFDRNSTRYPPEMVAAAFTLKEVGEVAGPIKTENGYYVIKLVEQRAAATRPLDDVKTMIRQRLVRQVRERRVQELLTGLMKNMKVEIDEKALNAVELPSRR
jgi:peptidyl-prolyl cis-trans isomerase C